MGGVFDSHGLTVTPANVLGIRRIILTEAAELNVALMEFRRIFRDGMPSLGGDPVSPFAAQGFTECINAYLQGCRARIEELHALGEHLTAAARDYGKTEAEIGASFRAGVRHNASPLVKSVPEPSGILGHRPDLLHPTGRLR